jgi:hypothetical protein
MELVATSIHNRAIGGLMACCAPTPVARARSSPAIAAARKYVVRISTPSREIVNLHAYAAAARMSSHLRFPGTGFWYRYLVPVPGTGWAV